MKKIALLLISLISAISMNAQVSDNPDTLVVARDGTGQFRNIDEALEVCRAFMEYHKVIYVKKGVYKEKLILPSWLTNVEICGEDRDNTIITYDDHANIKSDQIHSKSQKIGTFRTYTLRIDGTDITIKNITIENNAPRLGQAVALHTEGNRIKFLNCRFLGNQDTIYTGRGETTLLFKDCYIEGTTDFIFGPSTAWFENCDIYCKVNSYITAASTPQNVQYGYVFNNCHVTLAPEVTKMCLGRPWRSYAHTVFMNCDLPKGIAPGGWNDWKKDTNLVRYAEYNNRGEGARTDKRVAWAKQLTKKEAKQLTIANVLGSWAE